ncbi:uncharacterized protein [Gossypium hirsutum]|uniref:Uncharacterized protein isoform X11 n=1 Tax=Gossypium hirsutum TaxID=3635 RepID=A0ABM3AZ56_GOSHI|nr:uncharacterized protein LOC107935222 isoform X11 [Gossypium hirsutum]
MEEAFASSRLPNIPDYGEGACRGFFSKKTAQAKVGYVTTICFTCFLVRCIMMCFNGFDKGADLDVLNHPILNLIYYLLVEILPSSLVLFILRKLPPKRGVSLFAALGFLLYGGSRDDEDDSVVKMKAAEEALEAKQKVTNSLSATCSFFFYHVL